MEPLTQVQLDQFHRDGFLIFKNVFSKSEIEDTRKRITAARDADQGRGILKTRFEGRFMYGDGDVVGKRPLERVIFDPRITTVAHSLLGPHLVYFGDSSYTVGASGRSLHRDNTDRKDPAGPDWKGDYGIIRFGIYCQDHQYHSGGLKVRIGSHNPADFIQGKNIVNYGKGKLYNIPTEVGDLLVWSERIVHSGNSIRSKFLPRVVFSPRIENNIPSWLCRPEERQRMTIFVTFAAPSPHLDRHIQYQVDRGDYHDHWKYSGYHPEVLTWAETAGVEIRRPIPEYGSLYTA